MRIRWFDKCDLPQIMEIERESFEFPWTEEDINRQLRQPGSIGIVIEDRGEVIAYALFEFMDDSLWVVSFAVAKPRRRAGVGSLLLSEIKAKADRHKKQYVNMFVREMNLRAQLFLRSQGFKAIAIVNAGYDETDEDAYLMEFEISAQDDAEFVESLGSADPA